MERTNDQIVLDLYAARDRGDLEAVRSLLAEDVIWHEPDLDNPHTGDLHGPDSALGMIREAQQITAGTFRLVPREVLDHGEHAVALIDWSAERNGERIEGKEIAFYRVRDGQVVEASFHQDNPAADEAFWE
ncbi:MAG: nuclear transport factor 2 family protein [Rubrobacteraceae bacterium]